MTADTSDPASGGADDARPATAGQPRTESSADVVNLPHIPFVELLGIRTECASDGESLLRYRPQPEHHNSFAVVHGGVTMTLLDVTLAAAARCLAPSLGVVTIELKTSFVRPAQGELTARGRVLHRTATLAFTEGSVFDAEGRLCAHATGTFKYVRKLTVGSGRGKSLHLPAALDGVIATDG